jgi:hypothetical protein
MTPNYLAVANALQGAHTQGIHPYRFAHGVIVRGYVVKVYASDDASAPNSPAANDSTVTVGSVLCDVAVIEPGFRGMLARVPVLSAAGGISSVDYWQPQPLTADDKGTSVTYADQGPNTVDVEKTDGDLVVVGFFGNDRQQPVILGSLLKSNSAHAVTTDNLTQYAWVRHARDAVVGVVDSGEVLVDVSAQADAGGDDTVTLRASSAEVVVSGDGVVIRTDVDSPKPVDVTVGAGQVVTVSGNGGNPNPNPESVVLQSAMQDLATLLTSEWLPVLTAVASLFGIPLPTSASTLAGLLAGQSTTTGFAYNSTSLKAD